MFLTILGSEIVYSKCFLRNGRTRLFKAMKTRLS